MAIWLEGYGDGSFNSLSMALEEDEQAIQLCLLESGYGVELKLRALHRDGNSNPCRLKIDLSPNSIENLLNRLNEDLQHKRRKEIRECKNEKIVLFVEMILSKKLLEQSINVNKNEYREWERYANSLKECGLDQISFGNILIGMHDYADRIAKVLEDGAFMFAGVLHQRLRVRWPDFDGLCLQTFQRNSDVGAEFRRRKGNGKLADFVART